MKAVPETHLQGYATLENVPEFPFQGDFGIQITDDGRVWICLNGIAFLRFTPHPNRKMIKD